MKKIKCFLLACLMVVSLCSLPASAALPETVEPLWNNTNEVIIMHRAIGTTAHCSVEIGISSGAILRNVVIQLVESESADVVQTWVDPEMTVDSYNVYSFYGTVEDITPGNTYLLSLQCEVWRNGVCDYISQSGSATY